MKGKGTMVAYIYQSRKFQKNNTQKANLNKILSQWNSHTEITHEKQVSDELIQP